MPANGPIRVGSPKLEPRAGYYRPQAVAPLTLEVRPIDVRDRDRRVTRTTG